jgi:DNA (cytosine-5)-methyltransferase 1
MWAIWDRVVSDSPWNVVLDKLQGCGEPLIQAACRDARAEAWNFELGPEHRARASEGIRQRLQPFMNGEELPDNIVLIGGPPCQAYSLVGRARNRGKEGYRPEQDHRHFLYKEYLQVIAEFRPAVFIMENVKGILTSTVEGAQIFDSITSDLKHPGQICGINQDLEYVLVALSKGADGGPTDPAPAADDFIICTEDYGLPQARHRVIICGVRRDVFERARRKVAPLQPMSETTVAEVVAGLPRLRPALSWRGGGADWRSSFDLPLFQQALQQLKGTDHPDDRQVADLIEQSVRMMRAAPDPGRGTDRCLDHCGKPFTLQAWYRDRPLTLLANHESRAHMPEDLVRYLFVASFGKVRGFSPKLGDFPRSLLPQHRNVDPNDLSEVIFKDRFRVQLADSCSTTVTSHIGKDGHAFIHPDPVQCRSLTVREAARLQTFPDSYVFLGNRTSQYTQVGNAVPPLLACLIGGVVGRILQDAELDNSRGRRPAFGGSEKTPTEMVRHTGRNHGVLHAATHQASPVHRSIDELPL